MNIPCKLALPIALMMASACAMASDHLTPHQCNAYPFKTQGPVTHRDVMRELTELEAVGYRPGVDNYGPDINDARARLAAKYNEDCKPAQHATAAPSSSS
ncbi:DUF4148 domain-containing protein [Paraburkholderia sp. DHOC27]|uniref:DUF4148 domain-containing protein n=1 Tax=Paraburkholderia sp. DHOC27 TaxID=2303330 RepID=UPI000E3E2A24|nr:DUF4148 domain-containing protein [Paraburkholderia sp. DHOC27]RFU48271.1 DUF4148 domain-containing protein [Paraburkholderia sp. DHOC27]